jgi:hypothetical protein
MLRPWRRRKMTVLDPHGLEVAVLTAFCDGVGPVSDIDREIVADIITTYLTTVSASREPNPPEATIRAEHAKQEAGLWAQASAAQFVRLGGALLALDLLRDVALAAVSRLVPAPEPDADGLAAAAKAIASRSPDGAQYERLEQTFRLDAEAAVNAYLATLSATVPVDDLTEAVFHANRQHFGGNLGDKHEADDRAHAAEVAALLSRPPVVPVDDEPYEGCEKRGGVCDCAGRPCPVDDEPRNPYRGQPLYLEKCVVWDAAFAAGRAAEQAATDADLPILLEWAKFTRDESAGYWGKREEDAYQRLLARSSVPSDPKETGDE